MRYIFAILLSCLYTFGSIPIQISPYLKMHSNDLVKWHPWSKRSIELAKKKHKLIFLSIGYSTCHWCHVMQKESFRDKEVAKLLNRYFMPILIDKEEFPNIDKKYQRAYKKIHNKMGGWPLNIFMDENLKILYIAKYIPKDDAYGSIGLKKLLLKLKNERKPLYKTRDIKKNRLKNINKVEYVKNYIKKLKNEFDKKYGGFGSTKKYPKSSHLKLLFDYALINKDKEALWMVEKTLDSIISSSLYDVISGGFFRYTSDRKWLSPHFEKMLYTNALLLQNLSDGYSKFKKESYKVAINSTIKEMDRLFRDSSGLYYSAMNADSKEMEGGFYLFRYNDALKKLLDLGFKKSEIKRALKLLDISKDGNYDSEFALPYLKEFNKFNSIKKIILALNEIKQKKELPFIDKKLITSQNAMMIKAKLKASILSKDYKKEALETLDKLLKLMLTKNEDLYHQTLPHLKPTQKGLLEDYAYLIDAILKAYETTLQKRYLNLANKLTKKTIELFYKKDKNIWYLEREHFVKAGIEDDEYPSPLSLMIKNLIKLTALENSLYFKNIYKKSLGSYIKKIHSDTSLFCDDVMMDLSGVIVVKSSHKLLKKFQLSYPYLLKKPIKSDKYLCCGIDSCFAYGDLKEVVDKLTKFIMNNPFR